MNLSKELIPSQLITERSPSHFKSSSDSRKPITSEELSNEEVALAEALPPTLKLNPPWRFTH
jgi:hypothetical protein